MIGNGCCYAALHYTWGLAGISGQMGKCCVMIIPWIAALGVGVWIKRVTKKNDDFSHYINLA